jgi:hypothetical protein
MVIKMVVLGAKDSRNKVIEIVTSEGGKVLHDSGGRVLLIKIEGTEERINEKLPQGTKLLSTDQDEVARRSLSNIESSESIFLDALHLRRTPEYRDRKRNRRPPGEEPKEKELLSVSCTKED